MNIARVVSSDRRTHCSREYRRASVRKRARERERKRERPRVAGRSTTLAAISTLTFPSLLPLPILNPGVRSEGAGTRETTPSIQYLSSAATAAMPLAMPRLYYVLGAMGGGAEGKGIIPAGISCGVALPMNRESPGGTGIHAHIILLISIEGPL